MKRIYYFERLNGVEVLRVTPRFEDVPPDIGHVQMAYGKWSFIVNYLETKTKQQEKWPNVWYNDGGADTCAMCWHWKNCQNCPIRGKTGRYACFGTPFEQWKYETTLVHATAMRDYLWDLILERGII
jgi:hypothetical protein